MKNTYISIFLFIALVIIIFFLNNKFVKLCNEVVYRCDIIEDYLDAYDEENAYEDAVALIDLIKEEGDIPAIYLNHVDYDLLKGDVKAVIPMEKLQSKEFERLLENKDKDLAEKTENMENPENGKNKNIEDDEMSL